MFIRRSPLTDDQQDCLLHDIKQLVGPELQPVFDIRERFYLQRALTRRGIRRQQKKYQRSNALSINTDLDNEYYKPIRRQSHFNFSLHKDD